MFVGRKEWSVANTKTKKEKMKHGPRNVNFQNFEKHIFSLFYYIPMRPQPKIYVHMLKTMTSRSWDEIKIVKNLRCHKIVKN